MITLFLIHIAHASPLDLSYDKAIRLAQRQNSEIIATQSDIELAGGAVMASMSIFDPQMTGGVFRNFSTNQQVFAGFGPFETEMSGTSWSVGMSAFLPSGTSLSLNWNTNQNTTRYQLQGGEIEQEFSPYDTELRLNVQQPLLRGFGFERNLRGYREALRSQSLSEISARETRARVLSDVAIAYWTLHHQNRLEEISLQSVQIAKEEKRLIDAQVAEGNLAPVESERVEAALLGTQSALVDAENARQTSQEHLLVLLGENPDLEVSLNSVPSLPTENEWELPLEISKAMSGNLSLQRLKLLVTASESRLRDARHSMLPELTASVDYSLSGWEEEFGDAVRELGDRDLPGRSFGLNLNMPIANWSARGDRTQRIAELKKARNDIKAMERNISKQVRNQVRTLKSAAIKARLAQANFQLAEKTLATDRILRNAGRKLEKDVLDSIRSVENAKTEHQKSLSDYQLALIELSLLKGEVHR